jgi:rod shape-determining protein MreC
MTCSKGVSHIKHRFFVVCLSLALAIALFTGVFAVMGWGSLLRDVGSAIIYPFQWVFSKTGNAIQGFGNYFQDIQDLNEQMEALKAENESLKNELLEAGILEDENAWLYEYLSMKEIHKDYALCAATVTGTSSSLGQGGSYITEMTLNQGTASGVEAGMPVITTAGLVGVVVEAGLHHCRVSTILDTSVSVGAVTTRASENGLCEGDYAQIHNGYATLRYLNEEADVQVDDVVVTSGRGSVYPYGIPIGRITAVSSNAYSRTTEAVVEPFADFTNLTQVMVITSFVHYVDGYESGSGPGHGPDGGGS